MRTLNAICLCLVAASWLSTGCRTQSPPLMTREVSLQPQRIESPEEAAARAGLYANALHINLNDKKSPVIERQRSFEGNFLGEDDTSGYNARLRAKLVGKDYWAVYFGPSRFQLGGDAVFFIEVSTGALLGHCLGR